MVAIENKLQWEKEKEKIIDRYANRKLKNGKSKA